jgi:hypothetical protein
MLPPRPHQRQTSDQSLASDNVHFERFIAEPTTLASGHENDAFFVKIGHAGAAVPVAATQSIVDALRAVGIDIEATRRPQVFRAQLTTNCSGAKR